MMAPPLPLRTFIATPVLIASWVYTFKVIDFAVRMGYRWTSDDHYMHQILRQNFQRWMGDAIWAAIKGGLLLGLARCLLFDYVDGEFMAAITGAMGVGGVISYILIGVNAV